MTTNCKEYAETIKEEIYKYYNGEELTEEGETASLYDYFTDVLDYEFIIDSRRNYCAVRVCITLGGPNAYINTERGTLEVYWGCDSDCIYLDLEVIDEINDIFEEIYKAW